MLLGKVESSTMDGTMPCACHHDSVARHRQTVYGSLTDSDTLFQLRWRARTQPYLVRGSSYQTFTRLYTPHCDVSSVELSKDKELFI